MASASERVLAARLGLLKTPHHPSSGPTAGKKAAHAFKGLVPIRTEEKHPDVSRVTALPARCDQASSGRPGLPTISNQSSGSGQPVFISPDSKRVSLSSSSKQTITRKKTAADVIVISSDEEDLQVIYPPTSSSGIHRNGATKNPPQLDVLAPFLSPSSLGSHRVAAPVTAEITNGDARQDQEVSIAESSASAAGTQQGLQRVVTPVTPKISHRDPAKVRGRASTNSRLSDSQASTGGAQQAALRVIAPLAPKFSHCDPERVRGGSNGNPRVCVVSIPQSSQRAIAPDTAKTSSGDNPTDQKGCNAKFQTHTVGAQQGLQRVNSPAILETLSCELRKDLAKSNVDRRVRIAGTRQWLENTQCSAPLSAPPQTGGSSSQTRDKGKSNRHGSNSGLSYPSPDISVVFDDNFPPGQIKKRRLDHVELASTQVQVLQSDKRRDSGTSAATPLYAREKAFQHVSRLMASAPKRTSSANDVAASFTPMGPADQLVSFQALPLPKIPQRRRAESPDWSNIPIHLRPLQGRERPNEFETSLQETWLDTRNPDVSTPLAQMIFREEINSRQMWENPDLPPIEVIVPEDVKSDMTDDALAPPFEFVYTERIVYRNQERPVTPRWQCSCHGDCRNSKTCECRAYQEAQIRLLAPELPDDPATYAALKNWTGFAYKSDRKAIHSHKKAPDNGDPEARVVDDHFLDLNLPIFECNELCGCGPDCLNRTVGRGRRDKLNIKKTLTRGWGVFANNVISRGRLVTHYSGELITCKESTERSTKLYDRVGRTYVFDLDPWWIQLHGGAQELEDAGFIQLADKHLAREVSDYAAENSQMVVESLYAVDAFWFGNVSRFINHSCDPNTSILPIYINDNDHTRPIFAMFAKRAIKTGEEVTTSYSDPTAEQEEVLDDCDEMNLHSMGRDMACYCGAKNCKKYMFAKD